MKTYPESRLTDLLIEFDEMGFCPTTVCPNPEQTAIEWKEQIVKEIQKLQAENTELRERLDKDGLPVKVGDAIYIVFLDEIKEWQVEKIELCKDEYSVYCGHADTDDYTFVTSKEYGKWWFTDPAKAEARLKEIQEEI